MEFRIFRLLMSVAFFACILWLLMAETITFRHVLVCVAVTVMTAFLWWTDMQARSQDWANEQVHNRRLAEQQKQAHPQQPYQLYQQPIDLPPTPNPAPQALPPTQNQDF